MDFTTGTFEIGGIDINPNTKVTTLKENPNFQVIKDDYPYSTISVAEKTGLGISVSAETRLGEHDFKVDIYCVYNQIARIILTPILSEELADIDTVPQELKDILYQELRRRVCDAFLLHNLGFNLNIEPSKVTQCGLFYEFSWGAITRWIFLDGYPGPNKGGYIEIIYPDDWREWILSEFGK